MAPAEYQTPTESPSKNITTLEDLKEVPNWREDFQHLFYSATTRYLAGHREASTLFTEKDMAFMESIGARPTELYDYVEDWSEVGEPSFETILAIASVRYAYFVHEQQRTPSGLVQAPETFPSGHEILGGYRWLPRIIAKARAKLKGELPPDLMYGCGADRPFLKTIGIAPEEFLKSVWDAGSNDSVILTRIKESAQGESSR